MKHFQPYCPNSFQQFMFVEVLTNVNCQPFVIVSAREGRSCLQRECSIFICALYTLFSLERGFASVQRYFDRFKVLRAGLELLRSSMIF